MPFPLLPLLLMAGASAAGGVANSVASRRNQRDQNDFDREMEEKRLALQESELNPFRFQLNQARSANLLGAMGNSSYSRPTLTPQGAYGQSAPQLSGGFDFQPDPMMPDAARALQGTVMRGMTRPQDKRGGIDLVSLMAGDGGDLWADEDPRAAVPRATVPPSASRLRYGRG